MTKDPHAHTVFGHASVSVLIVAIEKLSVWTVATDQGRRKLKESFDSCSSPRTAHEFSDLWLVRYAAALALAAGCK